MNEFDAQELKHLTREMLEEFTNRCARLELFDKCSDEYSSMQGEILCDVYECRTVGDYVGVFEENGKEGVRNTLLGHNVLPPCFDKVHYVFNMGQNYVVENDGKFYIVQANANGNVVTSEGYDCIELFGSIEDCVKVKLNGNWGVLAMCGGDYARVVAEPLYDGAMETNGGYVILEKNAKRGLCKMGYMLPCEYDSVFVPNPMGWVKVVKNGEWGYIDARNEFTTDLGRAFLYVE